MKTLSKWIVLVTVWCLALWAVIVLGSQPKEAPYLFVITSKGNWCSPCVRLRPTLRHIEEGGLKVSKHYVDTPRGKQVAERHGVRSVPTIFLVVNGQKVGTVTLYQSRQRGTTDEGR